jgi:hypothetical protein
MFYVFKKTFQIMYIFSRGRYVSIILFHFVKPGKTATDSNVLSEIIFYLIEHRRRTCSHLFEAKSSCLVTFWPLNFIELGRRFHQP